MLSSDLLAECKELAFTIAPELCERPLYLIDSRRFDGLPVPRGGCLLGFAIPGGTRCDYNIRSALADVWQGPGNVVALCFDAIREAAVSEDAFRGCVLNVCVHELGHLLPMGEIAIRDDADLYDCELVRERQFKQRAEALVSPETPVDAPDNPHNVAFIRRCVHLWSRASLAGWSIPSFDLFGGDLWFCSQTPHYLAAVHRELFALRTANFATIEDTPPTFEFVDMWEGDLANYQKYQSPKESES